MDREPPKGFAEDYAGPAAFYSLLQERQKSSPLFLQRLTRARRRRRAAAAILVALHGLQQQQQQQHLLVGVATINAEKSVYIEDCSDLLVGAISKLTLPKDKASVTLLVFCMKPSGSSSSPKTVLSNALSTFLGLKEVGNDLAMPMHVAVVELPNRHRRPKKVNKLSMQAPVIAVYPDRARSGDEGSKTHRLAFSALGVKGVSKVKESFISFSLSYATRTERQEAVVRREDDNGLAVYMHYLYREGDGLANTR